MLADAAGTGAAAGAAISTAEALAADELAAMAIPDILGTGGVEPGTAISGSSRGRGRGRSSRRGTRASAGGDEAAARLARQGGGAGTRADAAGTGAAAGAAIGVAEALAADELAAMAIPDVLGTGGIEPGAAGRLGVSGGQEGKVEENGDGEGLHVSVVENRKVVSSKQIVKFQDPAIDVWDSKEQAKSHRKERERRKKEKRPPLLAAP
ncbi:hypothetical protein FGG08_005649 [Glutinoglossum americanum]|uniref:Uncharacterized protein n=1 Tax=Glutinoglossum americanum TaxID=1670608 RepID=A0A9P8HY00_9PEZI|nr:hypothetical protein FGG08_005649 [Glutinoglossum americanum]